MPCIFRYSVKSIFTASINLYKLTDRRVYLYCLLIKMINVIYLTEHEIVWSKQLSEWPRANRVHCTGLQVDENCSGHVSEYVYAIRRCDV